MRPHEILRREFRYRCGFCGVAETLMQLPYWIFRQADGDPVYTCRFCLAVASNGLAGHERLEHRNDKTYFRNLKFEPDGRLASLTPRGEKLIQMMDLNDHRKVVMREHELRSREACSELLRKAPPLIEALLRLGPDAGEHIAFANHLHDVLRQAEVQLGRLPEPIDGVYSQDQLDRFDCVSSEQHLTPHLIRHLERHPDDLTNLRPEVFEELVAEFFAAQGYKVHLVGRNSKTGADVFALKKLDPFGFELRVLIEVKRWRKKVGIEEIRKVAGALALERHKYGWHLALLVSVSGFRNLSSTTPEELRVLGIELRDKESLLRELREYKPRLGEGLWLTYGWEDCLAGVQIK